MEGRDRQDTRDAMESIKRSRVTSRPGVLGFQVFASVLLIAVAVMTATTFAYVFHAERSAREVSDERNEIYQEQVESILEEIKQTQEAGIQRGVDANRKLDEVRDQLSDLLSKTEG